MKKTLFIALGVLLLTSCGKENLFEENSESVEIARNKSAAISDIDWTGIPINIYLVKGSTGDRKYLSAYPDGSRIDCRPSDENTGRQKWILNKLSDGTYNIQVYSGISNARKFLSSYPDGSTTDLRESDENTGRQRWNLTSLGYDVYNITVKNGISNNRKFLSSYPDGTKVDLRPTDDLTGRQQWKFAIASDYKLTNITYQMNSGDFVIEQPDLVLSCLINNNTSTPQGMTTTFSKKFSESSSFTKTQGITITLSTDIQVEVPGLIKDGISTTVSNSSTWTFGKTESREDNLSYNFPIIVPAYTSYTAQSIIKQRKGNVTYEATFECQLTHKTKKIIGVWTGVQSYNVSYVIIDNSTKKVTYLN